MNRRLKLAIGCLACATSAVSAAPSRPTPAVGAGVAQIAAVGGQRITGAVARARAGVHGTGTRAEQTEQLFSQPPNQPLMKTYLVYQKNGRPLRVEAETIGFVRDGVVVLHNPEGQAIAVIPVTETGGIIEERAVVSGLEPEPAPKAKAKPAKAEAA